MAMQPTDIPAYMEPQWFFPMFVVGWFTVCGLLAFLSGWRFLAQRFPAPAQIQGERFRFVSASMGAVPWFPVNYSSCLFVTIGQTGFALSLLFPFRFLSPLLLLPWSQVESVEEKAWFFGRRTVVRMNNSAVKLTLFGKVGPSVAAAYARARAGNAL
jgi:hypothetical protein